MGLFDFLKPRKQKSAYDVLKENPLFRQQKVLFDAMNRVCATGCAGDELPNGHGEFGLTPTNPIPTNTIMGSQYYLSQLCTVDGKKVQSERRGHVQSQVTPMPIDVYDTFLVDGTRLQTIYISPYHQNNSRKPPRGFRLLFSNLNAQPAPTEPAQRKPLARYPLQAVIDDFHSFLTPAGGRTTQRPEYAAVRAMWPGLLQFLQPIVTGERLFSADAMNYAAPRLQRERTSITDERATERAIYFGLMSFTIIVFNNHRHRYPRINIDELADCWLSEALEPMASLERYDLFRAARPKIEILAKCFLIKHVQPNVTDNRKMDDALGWFGTQFLSGVLLGQITDALTLRDYSLEQAG